MFFQLYLEKNFPFKMVIVTSSACMSLNEIKGISKKYVFHEPPVMY